jgi:hypothetical protein
MSRPPGVAAGVGRGRRQRVDGAPLPAMADPCSGGGMLPPGKGAAAGSAGFSLTSAEG